MHWASVLSLPIRNWNIDDKRGRNQKANVLSLPIRNWNLLKWIRADNFRRVLSLPIRNWNIDCGSLFCSVCSGFESTYKELKFLPDLLNAVVCPIVLSLPIRNWNYQTKIDEQVAKIVLSLPIRNWNRRLRHRDWLRGVRFESTYKELKSEYEDSGLSPEEGFESTYKELK